MATSLRTVLTIAVLASACYQSPVPISTQAVPYDPALVGTWQSEETASDRMSVLQFDNGYYYVEMPWSLGSADTTRLRARAYLSDVDGTTFVNVQDIQGADRSYSFYRLTRLPDSSIALVPLKDMPKFTTSEALQAHLRAHVRDDMIYDNEARFRKVSER
jgi:hypothetical protein